MTDLLAGLAAGFIGSPSMNFMPVEVSGRTAKLPFCEVELAESTASEVAKHPAKQLMVGIRPEHFEDAKLIGDQPGPTFEVEVVLLESMGSELYAYFDTDAEVRAEQLDELAADVGAESSSQTGQVVARLDAASDARRGERIELWIDPTKLHFFDLESGERIAAGDEGESS